MNLLDEIINTAINIDQSLSVLLRQCLLLAHHTRNELLKKWANQELNGYHDESELPDYRVLKVSSYGTFSGYWGARVRWPIPPSLLRSAHRDFLTTLDLRQAISVYEADEHKDVDFPWPADLVLYYQTSFLEDFTLVSVSRPVSASTMRGLVDTVRNRTLNMALELKAGSEDLGNQGKLTTEDSEKISQAITHNVFNGPAYFASGEAQLNVSNDASQQSNMKGNKKALEDALLGSGVSKAEVDELTNVLSQDSHKVGPNTQSWISRVAPQICKDGAKAGVSVATSLLNEWLKSYLGLP